MASNAVSSSREAYEAHPLPDAATGWTDELWTALVVGLDVALRTCYGVREFTSDPECVLRVGLSPSPRALSLSDGMAIRIGDAVGVLHLWNEHLPRYRRLGPDLGWASLMR